MPKNKTKQNKKFWHRIIPLSLSYHTCFSTVTLRSSSHDMVTASCSHIPTHTQIKKVIAFNKVLSFHSSQVITLEQHKHFGNNNQKCLTKPLSPFQHFSSQVLQRTKGPHHRLVLLQLQDNAIRVGYYHINTGLLRPFFFLGLSKLQQNLLIPPLWSILFTERNFPYKVHQTVNQKSRPEFSISQLFESL